MVIARRNLMGGKTLPYLRRVAYLESHGTEYIDTGMIPKLGTRFESETYTPNGDTQYGCLIDGAKRFHCYRPFCIGGLYVSGETVTYPNFRTKFVVDNNLGFCEFDGFHEDFEPIRLDGYPTFCLFARNFAGTVGMYSSGLKVYSFKWSEFGTVKLRLIPVLDLSGRPAMYDEVSGHFFYNQGTGEFARGELGTEFAGGGGYKCVRRSWRSFSRRSRRSCALAARWEVAA